MLETQTPSSLFWKDKRVLITGGTKGLGKALTIELLEKMGAKVVVVARGEEGLEELNKRYAEDFYSIRADIGDKDVIHRISGQTIAMLEGIDVIINNASSLGPTPLIPLLDLQCEMLEEVLQVNLLGPFRLIKSLIPYMKLNGGGLVLNISSDAAVSAYPTWGAYSISKAALDHMTAIWGEELKQDAITFLSVDPGDMHTQMHMDAIPESDPAELYRPEDVARGLVEFLANPSFGQSRYSASQWREVL